MSVTYGAPRYKPSAESTVIAWHSWQIPKLRINYLRRADDY
jgi:hypothetical protein